MTKKKLIDNYNYKEGIIRVRQNIICLTKTDNKIFKILLDNYNKIVKVEKLCKKVYGEDVDDVYNIALRTAISRLRKKIKRIAKIHCKQRFGYRLEINK